MIEQVLKKFLNEKIPNKYFFSVWDFLVLTRGINLYSICIKIKGFSIENPNLDTSKINYCLDISDPEFFTKLDDIIKKFEAY